MDETTRLLLEKAECRAETAVNQCHTWNHGDDQLVGELIALACKQDVEIARLRDALADMAGKFELYSDKEARLRAVIDKALATFDQSADDAWNACDDDDDEAAARAEGEAQTWENAARVLREEAGIATPDESAED